MGLRLRWGKQPQIQGARWRRLDNTGKLFAAVTGEDLSNVFRLSAVLKEEVQPELLHQALKLTLEEYENFRVKLRKGFFWDYFETNNREPLVEPEEGVPCKFIDPHDSRRFPFRVSYYKNRMNLEVFHGLTDGLGALNFMKAMTVAFREYAGVELKKTQVKKPSVRKKLQKSVERKAKHRQRVKQRQKSKH